MGKTRKIYLAPTWDTESRRYTNGAETKSSTSFGKSKRRHTKRERERAKASEIPPVEVVEFLGERRRCAWSGFCDVVGGLLLQVYPCED